MNKIIDYIIERGKEPSTYRGLTVLLTVFGVTLSPELTSAIITTGASIFALIDILKKDKK